MQVTLTQSEIHQAIELYLGQIVNLDKTQEITIELEAKRDALGTRAYVTLTPNRVGATPKPTTAPVQVTAPVAPSVAVGEPSPAVPTPATTALSDVPAAGLDTSEAAPAEVETPAPAPVQSTPVAIADPSQVKPRTPRTPAEAVAWMEANPEPEVPEVTETTPAVELDGEPEVIQPATPPVEETKDESQDDETKAENAEVQVPNAVDPVQVVEQAPVSQVDNVVSETVPQSVTEVTPIAEPSASTQVDDLSPKVVEVEVNGELVTDVTHSDPALPTGLAEPEVVTVPSDAVVTVKDETTNELPTPAAPVETPVEGEAAPRRSLFR